MCDRDGPTIGRSEEVKYTDHYLVIADVETTSQDGVTPPRPEVLAKAFRHAAGDPEVANTTNVQKEVRPFFRSEREKRPLGLDSACS